MGSYCDVYIYENIDNTQFVSRSGYTLNYKPREELLRAVSTLHAKIRREFQEYSLVIVSCELMNWSYLGQGLIDKVYTPYGLAMGLMYEYEFNHSQDLSEYKRDLALLTKAQLKEKYPDHVIRHNSGLLALPDYAEMQKGVRVFTDQARIFGKPTVAPYFKPFGVVKAEKDGKVFVITRPLFSVISDARYEECGVKDYKEAENFFLRAREMGMEGVVVKPVENVDNCAIAFKVRTPEYLHLIYGADFAHNFNLYYSKRRIGGKLSLHLKQAKISKLLAAIPIGDITMENKEYLKLVSKFFNLETKGLDLDKRL
jgi:hypothetical protein